MSDELINAIPRELYIGGKWVPSSDGAQIEVRDPATEQVIATIASGSAEDALAAVDAADAAATGWAETAPRERAEILRRIFDLVVERKEDFAKIISREEGKSFGDAMGEMAYASEFFRWYAEEAPRALGEISRSPAGNNYVVVKHQPIGISLLITPWNFPAAMATRKIAPALAAGCTVILKPASETPLTALALAELYEEAGVPPGVINVMPSNRSSMVSNAILSDPRVRKVSFTGSTEVGRLLLAKAGENVISSSMELGGNAPFVILDDADLDVTVEAALVAKMRSVGESCIAANRFYVHSSIAEEFKRRFVEGMAAMKVGPGLEPGVEVGPLVNASGRDDMERLVNRAVEQGATVLTGGKRIDGPGYFFEPTVLVDLPKDADILHEEIFGPIAPIVEFDDIDEVVELANDTPFGLAAYICTRDVGRGLALADRIDAGILGLNRGFVSDPAAPFGGMKQSGLGREGSHEGMREFLETKYIAVDW
jgi:succinate-semialdehyde dehydrogenase/glutarate-semialdehyde dehydrogenase